MHRIELHVLRVLSRTGDVVVPYRILIYKYRSKLSDQFLVAGGIPLTDVTSPDSPVDMEHSELGANMPKAALIEKMINLFVWYGTDADIALKIDQEKKVVIPRMIILANGDNYRKTFSDLLEFFLKPPNMKELRKRRTKYLSLKHANRDELVPHSTKGNYVI